jgi:hypothetical protein
MQPKQHHVILAGLDDNTGSPADVCITPTQALSIIGQRHAGHTRPADGGSSIPGPQSSTGHGNAVV